MSKREGLEPRNSFLEALFLNCGRDFLFCLRDIHIVKFLQCTARTHSKALLFAAVSIGVAVGRCCNS
jgi:hypothetical protein